MIQGYIYRKKIKKLIIAEYCCWNILIKRIKIKFDIITNWILTLFFKIEQDTKTEKWEIKKKGKEREKKLLTRDKPMAPYWQRWQWKKVLPRQFEWYQRRASSKVMVIMHISDVSWTLSYADVCVHHLFQFLLTSICEYFFLFQIVLKDLIILN